MTTVFMGLGPGPTEAEWAAQTQQDTARDSTRTTLLAAAVAAIQADLDYLALNPPTTAQRLTQVDRLTAQMVVVLRLVANRLDP